MLLMWRNQFFFFKEDGLGIMGQSYLIQNMMVFKITWGPLNKPLRDFSIALYLVCGKNLNYVLVAWD
jgi:hypothetical protein